jgi:1,4-dihydroxy-2-naphthoyl-CoA hydrolase
VGQELDQNDPANTASSRADGARADAAQPGPSARADGGRPDGGGLPAGAVRLDYAALGTDPIDNARRIAPTFSADSESLTSRMGIEIIEASAQRSVATMPVAGNTQPYGLLHGGASCVLAETIGSLAAALHAGPDKITVGIEINATHHRSASSGLVTAVATMAHGGSTLTTHDIVISDERGRRVCTARLTCLLRDAVPGRQPGPPPGGQPGPLPGGQPGPPSGRQPGPPPGGQPGQS